jgi:hypothetical protein
MKKIVFCIIIILGFLNFHSEDVSAQELCQLGDGDVHFFTNSGEYITDTKIDLYLKTEGKCDSQELTIVVYEYDPCSRSSICNDDNALTMFENNKVKIKTQQGKNAQLKFTGQEEMCDNNSGSKPNCLIYVIIKDNQNKVIYSSREKIINLERDLSEHISELILNQGDSPIRSDDVKRASLKFLGQVNRDGLMLKYCGNFSGIEPLNDVLSAACFGREWSLSSISNADTIDADGNVIPNSNLQAQFIPEKQYIDPGSPCTNTENNEYLEDCYELLAPLPGFSSNLTDGTNNVITKGDRIAIADVKGLQFGDMVNSLFQISLGILMVLAVVMIVIAGVQYMTTESIYGKGDAKGRITNAITGLILALGIFVILNTINPKLLEVNFEVNDVRVKKFEDPAEQDSAIAGITSSINTKTCKNRKDRGIIESLSQKQKLTQQTKAKQNFLGNINIPKRKNSVGSQVEKNFAVRLNQYYLDLQTAGIQAVVTEAFPPKSTAHKSPCHYTGSCIDLATKNKEYSNEDIKKIIQIANKNGLTAQFEGSQSEVQSAREANKNIDPCMILYVKHASGTHFSIYDKSTNRP